MLVAVKYPRTKESGNSQSGHRDHKNILYRLPVTDDLSEYTLRSYAGIICQYKIPVLKKYIKDKAIGVSHNDNDIIIFSLVKHVTHLEFIALEFKQPLYLYDDNTVLWYIIFGCNKLVLKGRS